MVSPRPEREDESRAYRALGGASARTRHDIAQSMGNSATLRGRSGSEGRARLDPPRKHAIPVERRCVGGRLLVRRVRTGRPASRKASITSHRLLARAAQRPVRLLSRPLCESHGRDRRSPARPQSRERKQTSPRTYATTSTVSRVSGRAASVLWTGHFCATRSRSSRCSTESGPRRTILRWTTSTFFDGSSQSRQSSG
jgi:hypothetical protein